jgi:hypothetical protein
LKNHGDRTVQTWFGWGSLAIWVGDRQFLNAQKKRFVNDLDAAFWQKLHVMVNPSVPHTEVNTEQGMS